MYAADSDGLFVTAADGRMAAGRGSLLPGEVAARGVGDRDLRLGGGPPERLTLFALEPQHPSSVTPLPGDERRPDPDFSVECERLRQEGAVGGIPLGNGDSL
jgi:hypothetical protein